MKTTKIIALLIMITQIVSLAAFGLSIYSIYGVLSSTFSGGLGFEMDFDEATGVGSLRLEVTPQNTGYLDADVTLGLKLLDGDGVSVASDSSSVALAPGGSETISLVLEVSREDYERIALGGARAPLSCSWVSELCLTSLEFLTPSTFLRGFKDE